MLECVGGLGIFEVSISKSVGELINAKCINCK